MIKSSEIRIWYNGLVLNLGFWGPVFCKWSWRQPVSVGVRRSDIEAKIKMVPSQQKPVQPVESDKSTFSRNYPSQKWVSSRSELLYNACLLYSGISHVGGLTEVLGKAGQKGNGSGLALLFCLCASTEKTENVLGELCTSGGRKAPALVPSLIFPPQGGIWNSCH